MANEKKPRNGENESDGELTVDVAVPKVGVPPRYAVVLHNDDFTPMEFVVEVLRRFFQKSPVEAEALMWQVHNQGSAVAGVYSFEVAETKVAEVNSLSRQESHPLMCTMQKA